jgi:hypothetical protein
MVCAGDFVNTSSSYGIRSRCHIDRQRLRDLVLAPIPA